ELERGAQRARQRLGLEVEEGERAVGRQLVEPRAAAAQGRRAREDPLQRDVLEPRPARGDDEHVEREEERLDRARAGQELDARGDPELLRERAQSAFLAPAALQAQAELTPADPLGEEREA